MNTAIWIIQGLLAFAFLMAGAMKLLQPKEKVIASGGAWAGDFSASNIKIIGGLEVLCGISVIVPKLLHHGHYLTSIAASGIAILMAGAFYTHFRRKEYPFLLVTGILLLMALFVGYYTCPAIAK